MIIPFFTMKNANPLLPPKSPTSPISKRVQELHELLKSLNIDVPSPIIEPSFLEGESRFKLLFEMVESKEIVEELDDEIDEELKEEEEYDLEYFNTFPNKERDVRSVIDTYLGKMLLEKSFVKESKLVYNHEEGTTFLKEKSTIMGDVSPIRNFGDYYRPSHEGNRNAIELLKGAKHLKDYLRIVDSIDLNGPIRNTTRLRLLCFSLRDQAINWLDRLPAESILTWDDLTTRFPVQFFPLGRTADLPNNILMFQQRQDESLYDAWTRFKDSLLKVPHHGVDLWLQVQIFYNNVDCTTQISIDYAAGGMSYPQTRPGRKHVFGGMTS
nr:hypothetical protein [Tanacetum cinerariifolium]